MKTKRDKTMVPFRTSQDGFALGDHIHSLKPGMERHGIYAGSCRVVCYAGGVIAEVPLDTFSGGAGVDIIPSKTEFAAAEIVRRAKEATRNDSEMDFVSGPHFCQWCRRGPLPVE